MRLTDATIIQRYLDDLALQDKSEKTISDYHSCVRMYHRWLQENRYHICDVQCMDEKHIIEGFLKYLRFDYRKGDGGILSYKRLKSIFTALNGLYEYLEYNDLVEKNIILSVRKRYLKQFKKGYVPVERKVLDVQKMTAFINSIANLRDKTIVVVFVKTGIRRGELIRIDIGDIDLDDQKITLKGRMFRKRSNPVVFFDEETKWLLMKWLKRRSMIVEDGEQSLFVGQYGSRIDKNTVYDSVRKWAVRFGIYDERSTDNKDHFSPHNLRHCFTTYLRQNGMPREYIKELRGDKRAEIIDIYDHIDQKDMKREYLSAMPEFSIF